MFLGIDLGTTNIKALVVDRAGRIVSRGSAPVARHCTPDGGVEQDIEQIWTATCEAIREAVSKTEAPPPPAPLAKQRGEDRAGPAINSIEAIGVSSQGGALQLLDRQGQPLGPVISWLDSRARLFDQQLLEELGEDFWAEHVGCRRPLITPGQVLRLRRHAPELMAKAEGIGYVGDVIVGRLCGRRAHDATSLSIALLCNPSLGTADPEVLRRLEIRQELLPALLPADVPAGSLRSGAAEITGLPAGIPVSPAMHDQYAASLGVGAVHEGDVSLGTGTAWAMIANSVRLAAPGPGLAIVCPHPVRGLFGQLLSMVNGGSTLEWTARLLGRQLSCREVDEAVQSVPPASDGLIFWPHLVGLGGTDAAARGGGRIGGLRLAHGPEHLLRAAVEGLACELACHLERLAAGGFPVRRLLLSGGAAPSCATPQIIADVAERPVAAVSEPAVSAYGAAIVARSLVEPGVGLVRLAEQAALPGRTFMPDQHVPIYRDLYRRYLEIG